MKKAVLYTGVCIWVLAPGLAQAQDSRTAPQAAPDTRNPDDTPADIVVTAQKREQSVNSVPMSITAASSAQLDRQGVTSVQDLPKIVPGLSFVESGSSVPVYSLRGVGFFDTSIGARPAVSVYVDEVPLPFNIMTSGATLDVERVEVLKGPQGTLFGQNATGGAINYVANKPDDAFAAGYAAGYGSFNDLTASGYVGGGLSDTLSMRLSVNVEQRDGWQRSYTRDDTNGNVRLYQARLLTRWKPTSRLSVLLSATGFIDRGQTQAGQLIGVIPTVSTQGARIPDLTNYPLSPQRPRAADWDAGVDLSKDNRFYQLAARIDYELSDWATLTSLSSYADMRIRQTYDGDGTAVRNWLDRSIGRLTSFNQELRLGGTVGEVTYVLGGNIARDTTKQLDQLDKTYSTITYATLPFGPNGATYPYLNQQFTTKAVFGNVEWKLGAVTLHGGARYTQADLDYQGCVLAEDAQTGTAFTNLINFLRGRLGSGPIPVIPVGGCVTFNDRLESARANGSLDENNLSWRAGVDWKPASGSLLYANVSKGYKAGSAPAIAALRVEALNPVTQESALSYEIGFKQALARRTVQLNGAMFWTDYTDKQLLGRVIAQPNVFGPQQGLVNVPKSKIFGIEGQATFTPSANFVGTIGATYLSTKVTSDYANFSIIGDPINLRGSPFPYTPKWQVVSDAEYRLPTGGDLQPYIGGNIRYSSATRAGFGPSPLLDIDAYTIVDARIGVERRDRSLRVEFWARNLTDKYYWTNVGRIADSVRRLPGMPRTFGIRLTGKMR